MKPKIRTPYTGSLAKGEVNNFPSLTVPDQSLSVLQIIKRHTSGLSTTGVRVPEYDGGEDITGLNGRDFRTLDISEKHELIRQNADRIQQLQTLARENQKAIEEAQWKKRNQKFDENKNPIPATKSADGEPNQPA